MLLNLLLQSFLLSDHILCKESIVIVKKIWLWDFDIFIHFKVALVHLCNFYGDVCMWLNTIASKRCFWLSSNLICILQFTVRWTLLILINAACTVFYSRTKNNSYTLWLMESNSLKDSNIQMVNSIDLKFGMYIIGHHRTYFIDFGECRM